MRELSAALRRLAEEERALLELSLARGMGDAEIAAFVGGEPGEVARRRRELLDRLAGELRLDGREERDELLATLPDLPRERWRR